MTSHVFRLVWNRKRASGLIFVEILISFLVLCAVLMVSLQFRRLAAQPLGYAYEDVWEVNIGGFPQDDSDDAESLALRRQLQEVMRAVRTLPEVAAASLTMNAPFSNSISSTSFPLDGGLYRVLQSAVEPQLRETLGLELLSGRWIEPDDLAHGWNAVVLTQDAARTLFGAADPLGRDLPLYDDDGQRREPGDESEIRRVVGIIGNYKKYGRFDPPAPAMFRLLNLDRPRGWLTETILVRLHPGTARAFEPRLVAAMRGAAPQWTFDVAVLDDRRVAAEHRKLLPLFTGAIVAGFLILMVGLGLVGVLYLNVVRRTQEMGLRRALGATRGGVRRQILSELLALTTLAVVLGTLILAQLPWLNLPWSTTTAVMVTAISLAAAIICAFVIVCGLYPSWLATRVEPAGALQHE